MKHQVQADLLNAPSGESGKKALKNVAIFWFLTAAVGQLIFVYYMAAFYGRTALEGNWGAWTKTLIHGIIPNDLIGNIAVVSHLILSFIITVGGLLQLIPQIRVRFPILHRWNGRLYMLTAFTISIGGLYMVWSRGIIGGFNQHLAISLNAILIIIFAALALYKAVTRNFKTHRKWALRLFITASGVWFFRVGFMFWNMVHQTPVWYDPNTFTGPFLIFMAYAQYLLPLVLLELYFYAQEKAGVNGQLIIAGIIFLFTIIMAIGIFAATMGMWLPMI